MLFAFGIPPLGKLSEFSIPYNLATGTILLVLLSSYYTHVVFTLVSCPDHTPPERGVVWARAYTCTLIPNQGTVEVTKKKKQDAAGCVTCMPR